MRADSRLVISLLAGAFIAVSQSTGAAQPPASKTVHLDGNKAFGLISILVSAGAVDASLPDSFPIPHNRQIVLRDLNVTRESTFKYDSDAWIYKLDLYLATAKLDGATNPVKLGDATALWSYLSNLGLKTDLSMGGAVLEVNQVNCTVDADKPMAKPERFQCDLMVPSWSMESFESKEQDRTKFKVPTMFEIDRTLGRVTISANRESSESIWLVVDPEMVSGLKTEMRVYAANASRPAKPDSFELTSGTDFTTPGSTILNSGDRNFPEDGKQYVVEMDLTIFETPIRPSHLWFPEVGNNYRVLWHKAVRQIIEN